MSTEPNAYLGNRLKQIYNARSSALLSKKASIGGEGGISILDI